MSETISQLLNIVSENKEKITFLENELKKLQSQNPKMGNSVDMNHAGTVSSATSTFNVLPRVNVQFKLQLMNTCQLKKG